MSDTDRRAAADNDQFATSEIELHRAAQALILARSSLRSDGLPNEILADTALDMLLALYVRVPDHGSVDVHDIVGATPSPSIVSKRWLTALADMGLVELIGETVRQRVRLTAAGKTKVATSLSIVIEHHRRLMDGDQMAVEI